MAEDPGQGFGVYTAGEGMGGEGVPEIVESKIRQSGNRQELFESLICTAGADRSLRAKRIVEDSGGVRVTFPFPQKLDGRTIFRIPA